MMSSICSMPMLRRIISGVTPALLCSAGDICRWVVEAGWQASDLASPILTEPLHEVQRVVEALARREPADDAEGQQRAGAAAEIFLGQRIIGVVGKPA